MPSGAQTLVKGLVDDGVEVCFANPGTSEMHFVAALDDIPRMRAVLCLFEGVATGAADGYGRMAGLPASTLLHLGPGLAGGLANLHNARRAGTPVVNVVGDHALRHKRLDAPLESDIDALARTVSAWTRRTYSAADLATDAADAVTAALGPPGGVATLIVPADVSWSDAGAVGPLRPPAPARGGLVSPTAVQRASTALRSGEPAAILLGGAATSASALRAADRIAAATGARLLCETFPARLARGPGLPEVERLGYRAVDATAQLAHVRHLVLAGAVAPVAFFAYPGQSSELVPDGCEVLALAKGAEDTQAALEALAEAVAQGTPPSAAGARERPARPEKPTGALTVQSAAAAIGALLPEDAIVMDEANTSGLHLIAATAGAPPHDWLTLTGGSMGQGLPVAVGAAMARPDRPVLALEADGSAMYTASALWTQAREGLHVTNVIFSNRAYAVLRMELELVGAASGGTRAGRLLDLSRPDLDFVALARGMGVPAARATTAEEFAAQLERGLAEPGPYLIECLVPPIA